MIIISIITPLYNKGSYISETIASVLAQSYPGWEMLIVDNGSTDDGMAIAENFQLQDSRIKLLKSIKQGPGAARNYGIQFAQGRWIKFLDADDLLTPDQLEKQLDVVQKNLGADIICGDWQEFQEIESNKKTLKQPTGIGQSIESLRSSAIAFAPWAVHAALVKREILQKPYQWVEELDPYVSEDTAFWFRLISKYTVAYSSDQGALYRRLDTARDRYDQPAKWLKGIKIVHDNNIQFLRDQKISLTAKHCENLMRCYSDIYLRSRHQNNQTTAQESLQIAQSWLKKYFELGGDSTISLSIRKKLGLKLFLSIVSMQQFFKNKFKSP